MLYLAETDSILFLGSPSVEKLDELIGKGIYISDIPIHDATRDVILVGEQTKAQVSLQKERERQKKNKEGDRERRKRERVGRMINGIYVLSNIPLYDKGCYIDGITDQVTSESTKGEWM